MVIGEFHRTQGTPGDTSLTRPENVELQDDPPRTPSPVRARVRGLITGQADSRFGRFLGPYTALQGNRSLLFLFAAHTLSSLIDWLYVVALFILSYHLTHSATVVALLTFTRLLPYAVLLPFSGAVTDRFDARRLIILANVGRAAAIVALVLVHDRTTLPLAFPLVLVATALASLFRPALLASVPAVTPERHLVQANSMLGQVDMASFGAGPALAGFILLVGDARTALLAGGVGMLLSALCVSAVKLPPSREDAAETPLGIAGAWDGLRFLATANERVLLGIAVAWCGLTLFGGAYWALSVALAERMFHLGDAGVGVLNAAYAVGGLLGGFLVAPVLTRSNTTVVFVAGAAASCIAEALFGLSPAGALPFLFWFLTGLADAFAKITATTAVQAATPRHMRGRVFGALESLFIYAMVAGSLVVAPLIAVFGARTACVAVALAGLVLLGVALRWLVRLEGVLGIRVFLLQVPVLNQLSFDLLEELVSRLDLERYSPGAVIIREGDVGDRMYIVKGGQVQAVSGTGEGEKMLAVMGRGDYFGEIALLRDVPRTATCRSVGEVELYSLTRGVFLDLLRRSGEFEAAMRAEGDARLLAHSNLPLLYV